jgi:hypothetical protein
MDGPKVWVCMFSQSCRLAAVFLVSAFASFRAQAQVTIGSPTDTSGGFYGSNTSSSTAQSFTVPVGTSVLESFSALMNPFGSGGSMQGYVYSWNSSTALGTQVWSGSVTVPSVNSFSLYTFSNIDLTVTAGNQYMFVIGNTATSGYLAIDFASDNPYSGGALYNLNYGTPYAGGAMHPDSNYDMSFSATFDNGAVVTPVPESTGLMMGGLVLCAGLVWYYRRQGGAAPAAA